MWQIYFFLKTSKKLLSIFITFLLIGLVLGAAYYGVKSLNAFSQSVDKTIHPKKDVYMRLKVCSDLFGFHIKELKYRDKPFLLSFIPLSWFSKKDVFCVNNFMGMRIQQYLSKLDGCAYLYYSYENVPRGNYDVKIECYQIQEGNDPKLLGSRTFEVII